jgi:PEP-CTERM motif
MKHTKLANFSAARAAALLLSLTAAVSAHSQTVVVPDLEEDGGLSTPIRSGDRAYQMYLNASNFASITSPVFITGVQYRLNAPFVDEVASVWPSQPITFSDYTIQLSRASAAINAAGEIPTTTTTYVQNQGAGVTTVRTGTLTFAAGAFIQSGITGAPNPFGPAITFSTPYLYTPGQEMMFTASLTGYTPAAEPQEFIASAPYTPNVADAVASTASNSLTSTPGGFSSPIIVQFIFAPVPEPGTAALFLAGAVGMFAMRRRFIRQA